MSELSRALAMRFSIVEILRRGLNAWKARGYQTVRYLQSPPAQGRKVANNPDNQTTTIISVTIFRTRSAAKASMDHSRCRRKWTSFWAGQLQKLTFTYSISLLPGISMWPPN